MTTSIVLRPTNFRQAHWWWANSEYPARAIFSRKPLELHAEEIRRILQVGRRFLVEFERHGLRQRIELSDIPETLAGRPVEKWSWLRFHYGREALEMLLAVPIGSALLALALGAIAFFKTWPSFSSAQTAVGAAIFCLALFPTAVVLLHAKIAWRRCRLWSIRGAIKMAVVGQMLLAVLITFLCFRAYAYSEFAERPKASAPAQPTPPDPGSDH